MKIHDFATGLKKTLPGDWAQQPPAQAQVLPSPSYSLLASRSSRPYVDAAAQLAPPTVTRSGRASLFPDRVLAGLQPPLPHPPPSHRVRSLPLSIYLSLSATSGGRATAAALRQVPSPSPIYSPAKSTHQDSRPMECVVQGIIETQHVEALEVLLQGLSGVPKERVRVHELCLKSGPNLGVVPSEVRLLCDLAQPTPSWTIRHVGGAMRGAGAEQISVLVRTVVESKASKNVLHYFYTLGYKLDHELLKIGFAFRFHRGAQITVTVTSTNKMPRLHATDEAVPVTPGIQLVEITAPAAADNYNDVVSAVCAFCEYLAPLLHLSKPGHSTGIVATAGAAAASLMSSGGGKTL